MQPTANDNGQDNVLQNNIVHKEQSYKLIEKKRFKNGGVLSVLEPIDKQSGDYNDIITIGRLFAERGEQVQVLGKIHFKNAAYQTYFGELIGTTYFKKCPDFKIGDKFYEYEGYEKPWNRREINNMLSHGLKQSDCVILNNNKGASDRILRRAIMARLQLNKRIQEVWIYEKGKLRLLLKNGLFIKKQRGV